MLQNNHHRKFILFFALLVAIHYSVGQKTEVMLNASSGLFSFKGDGSTSNSWIISYPFVPMPMAYTINPYGKKNGFSYSLELQGQRLTKRKNIYGLALSFENLISKVNIYKLGISGDPAYFEYSATGSTKLKNRFVTLNHLLVTDIFIEK